MGGRAVPYAAPMGLPGNRPLPGFFSTSAGLSGNRAVGPKSCHAGNHGTELGFPMPYFFVIVPLGVQHRAGAGGSGLVGFRSQAPN